MVEKARMTYGVAEGNFVNNGAVLQCMTDTTWTGVHNRSSDESSV